MNILVIDGNPRAEVPFQEYLASVETSLVHRRHRVTQYAMRDKVVADCQRCYGCWVKSPGECLLPDSSMELRRLFVESDVVVLASPLVMGYPTALLQRAIDRLLPLLLPYWEASEHGMRHEGRYEKLPSLALLVKAEADIDSDDLSILNELFASVARQLGTTLKFIFMMDVPAHEVAYEIHRI